MCKDQTEEVLVEIPADLSHTGKAYLKYACIDKCIAPLVRALQHAEINMRGSCCGHGEGDGEILLADGRVLIIQRAKCNSPEKYARKNSKQVVRTINGSDKYPEAREKDRPFAAELEQPEVER